MDDFLKNRVQKLVKAMKSKVRHKNAVEDVLDANRIAEMGHDSIPPNKTPAVLNKDDDECDCKDKDKCECDEIAPCDDEIEKAEKFVKSVLKNFKVISDAYIQKLEKGRMATDAEKRQLGYDKQAVVWRKKQKEIKGTKLDYDHPQFDGEKTKGGLSEKKRNKFKENFLERMASSEMAKKQGVPKGADPATHERCVKKVKKKGHDKSSAYAICNEAGAGMGKAENRCWEGYEPTPGKEPYSKGSCQKKSEGEQVKDVHGRYEGPDRRKKNVKNSRRKGLGGRRLKSKKVIEEKRSKERKRPYDKLPKKAPNMDIVNKKVAERKTKEAEEAKKAKESKKQQARDNAKKAGLPEMPEFLKEQKKAEKPFHGYNKEKHSKKGGLSEKERNRINKETGSNLKAPVSSKEAKKSPKKAARRKSFCARMSGNKGPTSKNGKLTPKGAALKRWDC